MTKSIRQIQTCIYQIRFEVKQTLKHLLWICFTVSQLSWTTLASVHDKCHFIVKRVVKQLARMTEAPLLGFFLSHTRTTWTSNGTHRTTKNKTFGKES